MVSKSYLIDLKNEINEKPPGSVYNGVTMMILIDEILILNGWDDQPPEEVEVPLMKANMDLAKPGMVIEECDT